MIDNPDPDEMKVALGHVVHRIEPRGDEIKMACTFDLGEKIAFQWRPRGDSNP
jgi:hypothetical protein